MAPLTVRSLTGTVLAEYPDFESGTRLRVLPAIVSSQLPIDTPIVDDAWSFVGPTRHPEYAHIRHDRDTITIAIERNRLQPRPQ
jgi:hypothetical protein